MSYITVPAKEVLELAETKLKRLREFRIEQDEKSIAYQMTKKKFWSRKNYTREEAISELNKSEWGWRSLRGLRISERLETLIVLAKHGDPVMIDGDDARALYD